jgi:hypothetical protein
MRQLPKQVRMFHAEYKVVCTLHCVFVRIPGWTNHRVRVQRFCARAVLLHEHSRQRERTIAAAAPRTEEQREAVWVFEAWRRGELARRREAMLAAAEQRMATLEALALSRETARQRDVAAAADRVSRAQARLLARAEEMEGREARLQAAQEAALRRGAEAEAEHAGRTEEAGAAVARLQAEAAAQLEAEGRRREAAQRERAEAEAELAAAQVRCCCTSSGISQCCCEQSDTCRHVAADSLHLNPSTTCHAQHNTAQLAGLVYVTLVSCHAAGYKLYYVAG